LVPIWPGFELNIHGVLFDTFNIRQRVDDVHNKSEVRIVSFTHHVWLSFMAV
jgi:hypothetical protein